MILRKKWAERFVQYCSSPKTSVIYGRIGLGAREKLENPRRSRENAGWLRSASPHPSEGFE
jgi:hypothetical protein